MEEILRKHIIINEHKGNGLECRSARTKYDLAKKIHSRNPSQSNKAHLIEASKIYKNKMNFHINKFNKKKYKLRLENCVIKIQKSTGKS